LHPGTDLYINMMDMQLTDDALRIVGFDMEVVAAMAGEFAFTHELAHAGKIAREQFTSRGEIVPWGCCTQRPRNLQ